MIARASRLQITTASSARARGIRDGPRSSTSGSQGARIARRIRPADWTIEIILPHRVADRTNECIVPGGRRARDEREAPDLVHREPLSPILRRNANVLAAVLAAAFVATAALPASVAQTTVLDLTVQNPIFSDFNGDDG